MGLTPTTAWLSGELSLLATARELRAPEREKLPGICLLRPICALAATIKARWICEQAHQQLKEELGLDHFEGRSWQGLHRHALMIDARLRLPPIPSPQGKSESTDRRPRPSHPTVRHAIVALIARPPPQRCPHCRKRISRVARSVNKVLGPVLINECANVWFLAIKCTSWRRTATSPDDPTASLTCIHRSQKFGTKTGHTTPNGRVAAYDNLHRTTRIACGAQRCGCCMATCSARAATMKRR